MDLLQSFVLTIEWRANLFIRFMAFKIQRVSWVGFSSRLVRTLLPPFVVCVVTIGCGCGLTACVVFVWVCTVSVPVLGLCGCFVGVVVGPVGTGVGLHRWCRGGRGRRRYIGGWFCRIWCHTDGWLYRYRCWFYRSGWFWLNRRWKKRIGCNVVGLSALLLSDWSSLKGIVKQIDLALLLVFSLLWSWLECRIWMGTFRWKSGCLRLPNGCSKRIRWFGCA